MKARAGSTHEGRPINAIRISDNVGVDEDKPRILIVSCCHAREVVTPEIAFNIIGRLMSGCGTDPANHVREEYPVSGVLFDGRFLEIPGSATIRGPVAATGPFSTAT